jgi:hypothetical protein
MTHVAMSQLDAIRLEILLSSVALDSWLMRLLSGSAGGSPAIVGLTRSRAARTFMLTAAVLPIRFCQTSFVEHGKALCVIFAGVKSVLDMRILSEICQVITLLESGDKREVNVKIFAFRRLLPQHPRPQSLCLIVGSWVVSRISTSLVCMLDIVELVGWAHSTMLRQQKNALQNVSMSCFVRTSLSQI